MARARNGELHKRMKALREREEKLSGTVTLLTRGKIVYTAIINDLEITKTIEGVDIKDMTIDNVLLFFRKWELMERKGGCVMAEDILQLADDALIGP